MNKVCESCGELKEHYAKGLCKLCYQRDFYHNRVIVVGETQIIIPRNTSMNEALQFKSFMKKQILQDAVDNPRKYLEAI